MMIRVGDSIFSGICIQGLYVNKNLLPHAKQRYIYVHDGKKSLEEISTTVA
jgi:hypothetical protein